MIEQVPLTILSLLAVFFLTGKKNQRWGNVFGLLSQPFWLYATYKAGQWGMFALSFVYTGMWIRGIYNGWWANDHS